MTTNFNFNMEYQLTVKDLIAARQLASSKARGYKFSLFALAIILFYIAIVIFRIDSLKFLVLGVYYSASKARSLLEYIYYGILFIPVSR